MRLRAARRALRDRILRMVRGALRADALPGDLPEQIADLVERAATLGPHVRPVLLRAMHLPAGVVPHTDSARCGCHLLGWKCLRWAALAGVDASPPHAWSVA